MVPPILGIPLDPEPSLKHQSSCDMSHSLNSFKGGLYSRLYREAQTLNPKP